MSGARRDKSPRGIPTSTHDQCFVPSLPRDPYARFTQRRRKEPHLRDSHDAPRQIGVSPSLQRCVIHTDGDSHAENSAKRLRVSSREPRFDERTRQDLLMLLSVSNFCENQTHTQNNSIVTSTTHP
jgi:hypothetical protein